MVSIRFVVLLCACLGLWSLTADPASACPGDDDKPTGLLCPGDDDPKR